MNPSKKSSLLGASLLGATLCLVGCRASSEGSLKGTSALQVGQKISDIRLSDQTGKDTSLSQLAQGGFVLVYFYPKDNTPGCTKEACALRDNWTRLSQAGVAVVGVSRDSVDKHQKFAEEHQLPFSLVADNDGKWGETFGVSKTLGMYARKSFLLSESLELAKIYPDVDPGLHARQVVEDVVAIRKAR